MVSIVEHRDEVEPEVVGATQDLNDTQGANSVIAVFGLKFGANFLVGVGIDLGDKTRESRSRSFVHLLETSEESLEGVVGQTPARCVSNARVGMVELGHEDGQTVRQTAESNLLHGGELNLRVGIVEALDKEAGRIGARELHEGAGGGSPRLGRSLVEHACDEGKLVGERHTTVGRENHGGDLRLGSQVLQACPFRLQPCEFLDLMKGGLDRGIGEEFDASENLTDKPGVAPFGKDLQNGGWGMTCRQKMKDPADDTRVTFGPQSIDHG